MSLARPAAGGESCGARFFFHLRSGNFRKVGIMEKKRVELLAPAGSFESLKAAVAAGADAVYMGGTRFGARAYADNADEEKMLEAIDYVHLHGCRLYMTVNTLFKEREMGELYGYMLPYYRRGLDGVIVQDLGALDFMREHFPGMELHASTQMTITSVYGAKLLKRLGCSRVVTARELSLEEIKRIHKEAEVEIEGFVHGALCYCYSGQCLMSSLIGGRSGNRGRCAQPCRLPYEVYEEAADSRVKNAAMKGTLRGKEASKGSGQLNKNSQRYVLNLKDLCTLDILPDIIEAGVYSLKIEGRMKSPRYTAGVVTIYRKYIDRYLAYGREGYYVEPEDKKLLLDLFDRGGFTSGYYTQHNGRDMIALKEKPDFREGNQKLFDYLEKTYVEAELKEPVRGKALLEEGSPMNLTLCLGTTEVTVEGQIPAGALKQPITEEKVVKQLNKTGGTPFRFEELAAEVKGDVFLPVQALNEIRRDGLEALKEAVLGQWMREELPCREEGEQDGCDGLEALKEAPFGRAAESGQKESAGGRDGENAALLTVSLEEEDQLAPVLACKQVSAVYIDAEGFEPGSWKKTAGACHEAGKRCLLMLPQIFRSHAMSYFKAWKRELSEAGFDGLLAKTLEEVQWLKDEKADLPVALDASVYAWNSRTISALKSLEPAFITMPWELSSRELQPVANACRKEGVPSELFIYGYAPMMVSAQCITRTVKGCTKTPGILRMKDRTGALLAVKNRCSFCYNTIFNPHPLSLLGNEELVGQMGLGRLRLAFTIENAEEVSAALGAFVQAFINGEAAEPPFRDFTRGHFKRGVE